MHLLIAREAVDAHLSVAGDLIDPDKSLSDKAKAGANAGVFYAKWLPKLVAGQGQLPRAYAEFNQEVDLSPHLRYVERSARKLARSTFYAMSRWQGRMETKQGFLGRIVDIGAELFAMSAACVRAELLRTTGSTAARPTNSPTPSAASPASASTNSSAGCGPTPTTSTARWSRASCRARTSGWSRASSIRRARVPGSRTRHPGRARRRTSTDPFADLFPRSAQQPRPSFHRLPHRNCAPTMK